MVSQLLSLGCNTKLVYLADITDPPETPVCKKYHLQFTNDIHDNNHNIFIVPETLTEILSKVCRMQNTVPGIIIRKDRCYLPVVGGTDIEIITAADADFLYGEKRIMKFFGLKKRMCGMNS